MLYHSDEVEDFGRDLLIAYEVPADIATDVIQSLVLSDLSGHLSLIHISEPTRPY